mmetsp:Transcript_24222/g.35890  ORF Transcript_24222/g.35890 Transcript_24222/m.35890 type:complete len:154 (+) Transcript_24222:163-624(+)|eukprot:CAMPEP_0194211462 /NCGR_PEP_ID=MMETSP0156-20130528/10311_1 /TAXON_ID=33649 /ORGANISM="Thalassionema nitzschioides, Strain L26-B" /LENGTH=153 /DNA_ID=CAMNT_0038939009 /DNA_START=153 /DNA_END=614 /DNA_ORIENTATION=-
MASSASTAKAQELNSRMETEARLVLEQVEKQWLRKIAKSSYECVVTCFDKAGTTGPSEVLEQCSQNCQVKYQNANSIVQNETNQFQNRLNRAMMDCQDEARDMIKPGMESDPNKIAKVEAHALKCMSKTVDAQIKKLRPLKDRIVGQLKEFAK